MNPGEQTPPPSGVFRVAPSEVPTTPSLFVSSEVEARAQFMVPAAAGVAEWDWMDQALELAAQAAAAGEVPVAALVVRDGQVIGRGVNQRHTRPDPTGHAELLALREAAAWIGDWRLERCTLIVTLEPCIMCAGALLHARVPRVVFGCRDPKFGAVRSLYRLLEDPRLNHRAEVIEDIRGAESAALLQSFFRARRRAARASPTVPNR